MTTSTHMAAAPQRHAQPATTPPTVTPKERQARAAAQAAYDEVMAGTPGAFSSTHSRTAGAAVSAHATARTALLDGAVRAGKFTDSRRGHYAAAYDRDPAGTTKLIAGLVAIPGLSTFGKSTRSAGTTAAGARLAVATDHGTIDVPADGPLPPGVSLLHGQEWRESATRTREHADLEPFAVPAGESLLNGPQRLEAAARRREDARLAG